MPIASKLRFLKPTLLVILCYLLAMCILVYVTGPNRVRAIQEVEEFSSQLEGVIQPSPSLTPTEVVQIQLEGLSNDNSSIGILQCRTFASPGNRTVTGPLERFGRIVRSEEFAPLQNPDRTIIGKPTVDGEITRILVSVVAERKLRSYVWLLSKQTQPPFENCWMTDSVFAVESSNDERPRPLDEVN